MPIISPKERLIEESLNYIRTQMSIQESIHIFIEKEFDKLLSYGYPEERIELIRKEFSKPIHERDIYGVVPLTGPYAEIYESLKNEIVDLFLRAVPENKDVSKANELATKILNLAAKKTPITNTEYFSRLARSYANKSVKVLAEMIGTKAPEIKEKAIPKPFVVNTEKKPEAKIEKKPEAPKIERTVVEEERPTMKQICMIDGLNDVMESVGRIEKTLNRIERMLKKVGKET